MSIDRKTELDKKDYQLIDMHPTEMPLPYNNVDIDGVHTHTHKNPQINFSDLHHRRHKYVTSLHKLSLQPY